MLIEVVKFYDVINIKFIDILRVLRGIIPDLKSV